MRSSTTTLEWLPTLRAAQFNDAGWLEPGARNDYVSDGLVAAIVAAPDGLLITALTTTGALTSVRIATGWRAGGRDPLSDPGGAVQERRVTAPLSPSAARTATTPTTSGSRR
jgi:hypothetical protein